MSFAKGQEFLRSKGISLVNHRVPDELLERMKQFDERKSTPDIVIPSKLPHPSEYKLPVIPEEYKYNHRIPEGVLQQLVRNFKPPRSISILVQPEAFSKFNCYVSLPLSNGRNFFTSASAPMDTGAPYGGLIYAVDDPCALAIQGDWLESAHSFTLCDFADVEIAGHIYSRITIVRYKGWSCVNPGDRDPVIGGHLLARLAVSFVGLEVSASNGTVAS